MSDARRFALRCAALAAFIHAAVSGVAVAVEHTISLIGWEVGHLLRLLDSPVLWLIEWTAQNVPLFPPWASFGSARLSSAMGQALLHAIFGGAFYAFLAAAVALLVQRRRTRRALAALAAKG